MLIVVALAAGCQPATSPANDVLMPDENVISVYVLAQRLGMAVAADAPHVVALRNQTNIVQLCPGEPGRVFVNGKAIGRPGLICRVDGVMFVADEVELAIKAAIKPVVVQPPVVTRRRTIVIDAGHGGHDPGAISPVGLQEKHVVLLVALEAARLLRQAGHNVILTRGTDTFIALDERARIANRGNAELFVSVHADAAANREARGFTVYTCRGASSQSRAAAAAVVASMQQGSGLASRGAKTANYRVLVATACPAILVELGFLSNQQEAMLLRQEDFRNRLAKCLAAGIVAWANQ